MKYIKSILFCFLMVLFMLLWRDGKNILLGIYIVFPIIFILLGLCSFKLNKEFIISLILLSIFFFIPINIFFNMGYCFDLVIIYNILSVISYLIKRNIKR